MRIEARGIRVDFTDLATILEGEGDYTQDDDFMQRTVEIAKQTISADSDKLNERLVESDRRFPLVEGLLDKLTVLDEASRDELSRMMHVLSTGNNLLTHPQPDDAVFRFEHAPALIKYIDEKLVVLEEAKRIAMDGIQHYLVNTMKHKIAQINYSSAHRDMMHYQGYKRALENLVGPTDMPDEH